MAELKKKATRESYGEALAELGDKYDNLYVFDADLAASAGGRGGEHREHCFRRGDQWQLWLSAVLRIQGRCRSVYESAGLGSGAAGTGQLYLPGRCGDADAG